MNVQYIDNCKEPRAIVWCMSTDLTDNNDGTYSFVDTDFAATLGTGSEIIVMDLPTIKLYYNATTELAYDWTTVAAADNP